MRMLLATAFIALGIGAFPAVGGEGDGPALDGKWLVVYAEEGGRRNNAWEQRVATIKGDQLSYQAEEKTRSLQLTFGPNQTLTAKISSDGKDKTLKGVCIVGQDYLCISLVTGGKAKDTGKGASTDTERTAAAQGEKKHRSSGDFIVILRRQLGK